jgi:hypothetical protein
MINPGGLRRRDPSLALGKRLVAERCFRTLPTELAWHHGAPCRRQRGDRRSAANGYCGGNPLKMIVSARSAIASALT